MDPENDANQAGGTSPEPAPPAGQETPPEGYLSKEQLDALVKARIDKQSAKHAKEVGELRSQLEAAQAERDSAKAEVEAAKAREERAMAVEKAAAAAGVPAKVLAAMAGDTAEEIGANAKLLAEAIPKASGFPEVPDGGAGGPGAVTVEDIEAMLEYQSECHCAKTTSPTPRPKHGLEYQSECHCAKTGRRSRPWRSCLSTSQNVTAPKPCSAMMKS